MDRLSYEDLINDLSGACKPKSQWLIGLEHEHFAYEKQTGKALPYDGEPGIRQLLESFASAYGWEPVLENGHVIALHKDESNVTLEPGGQVEYAGPPVATLTELQDRMQSFYHDMNKVAAQLGIAFLNVGFHPFWKREDIHWMPKARYKIMRAYMPKVGNHGLDMMLRTSSIQYNFDFDSEQDMVTKARVAMGLQPALMALTANSPCAEGKDTGYASYRSYGWSDTDPDRCGILPFIFEDDMGFQRYVDYALDVPMYFIMRNGEYIDVAGQSFRDFMAGKLSGHEGTYPTLKDWHDHLTTLFPEVRLKHYLELRALDTNNIDISIAGAAFWTGLLYDETALAQAARLIERWPPEWFVTFWHKAMHTGMDTVMDGIPDLRRFTGDLLDLASTGLQTESTHLLTPLYELLQAPRDVKRCENY